MTQLSLHLSRAAVCATLLALFGCGGGGSTATTVKPKVYSIGASYSSDGPEDPRNAAYTAGYRSGDARNVNGAIGQALWVEVLANNLGALSPVSNSRAPSATQSATNFARGDGHLLELRTATQQTLAAVTAGGYTGTPTAQLCSVGVCVDTKFPKSATDQWLALAATSPTIKSTDVFTIDSGGNDLLYQHLQANKGVNVTVTDANFITDRVAVIQSIVNKAIALGFKKITIANIPPLGLLPGVSVQNGVGGIDTTKLGQDVTTMNTALDTLLSNLKTANPTLQFYKADWNTAITRAINSSNGWTTPVTATAGDDFAFAISATADVMWWDTDRYHPSGKLHQYMADNLITEIP